LTTRTLDARRESGRVAVAATFGGDALVVPRQVHGRRVVCVDQSRGPGDADGLVVSTGGLLVAVLGADCPLALIVDPRRHVLGVVHSGWRGTVAGVVPAALDHLAGEFGCEPGDLHVGLGPAISAARYEIGDDVADALRDAFPRSHGAFLRPRQGDKHEADVREAVRLQLIDRGVKASRIETVGRCTYDEPDLWFSYRREGPAAGRHALVAGWSRASADDS
jgi:YfiH family protein